MAQNQPKNVRNRWEIDQNRRFAAIFPPEHTAICAFLASRAMSLATAVRYCASSAASISSKR